MLFLVFSPGNAPCFSVIIFDDYKATQIISFTQHLSQKNFLKFSFWKTFPPTKIFIALVFKELKKFLENFLHNLVTTNKIYYIPASSPNC